MRDACGVEIAVEDCRVKVHIIRPNHSSGLWINRDLGKELEVLEGSKNVSLVPPTRNWSSLMSPSSKVRRMTWGRHFDCLDVGDPVGGLHGNGSRDRL
jgi:hypothetical protein